MLKIRIIKLILPVFIGMLPFCCACAAALPPQPGATDIISTNSSVTSASASIAATISTTSETADAAKMLQQHPPDWSNWKLTEAQAIANASQRVPAEIVSHAKILAGREGYGNSRTGEIHYIWDVTYMNISVTKSWLGWQPDNQTILDSEGPYNEIVVVIDAVTGECISRHAYFAEPLGGPGMTPSTITPWSPPVTIVITPIQ